MVPSPYVLRPTADRNFRSSPDLHAIIACDLSTVLSGRGEYVVTEDLKKQIFVFVGTGFSGPRWTVNGCVHEVYRMGLKPMTFRVPVGVEYCEGRHVLSEHGEVHIARFCSAECWAGCQHINQTDDDGIVWKKSCSKCCTEPLCNDMNDMSAGAVTPVVSLLTMLANFAFILFTRFV
ncbi:uncharacterized protein LOC117117988 [Anneissia japonica]|uniref:uncharacterized protein LOC117117988 n=1 Tax=Anneissia japonica TaxID=1529436 RepID=UPI001425A9BA|nr:uncharacterized protein LOC117117988 [Anneissia japonica]